MDGDIHELYCDKYNHNIQLQNILFPINKCFSINSHNKIIKWVINYIINTKRFLKERLLLDLKYFKHT